VTAGGASIDELQGRLRDRLPWYMLPRRILLVERLPLTTNGKTDRRALQSLLEAAPGDAR
jgi:acyl-coenzyme A synthetase/AMP-(fatty) acid ligase